MRRTLLAAFLLPMASSFFGGIGRAKVSSRGLWRRKAAVTARCAATMAADVSVALAKPLGLVLEEVTEGTSSGVFVEDILDGGSAFGCDEIKRGMRLVSAEGRDCTKLGFDDVMDCLGAAISPVDLVFSDARGGDEDGDEEPEVPVTLRVTSPDKPELTIDAFAGDNLRTALQAGGAGIYDKWGVITNCNGGGQCGTCVVEVIGGEGCGEKSEWETKKLGKRPATHRLSCQTNIEGDATIALRPPK